MRIFQRKKIIQVNKKIMRSRGILKILFYTVCLLALMSCGTNGQFHRFTLMPNTAVSNIIQSGLVIRSIQLKSTNLMQCNVACTADKDCALITIDTNNTCQIYSNRTSLFELIPSKASKVMIKSTLIDCPVGILEYNATYSQCQCLDDA